jgi:two-component system, chemotaxis family, sensor kinase CheA
MDDLLADFLAETTESLADLDLALVRLERAPQDAATVGLIFRHVHTIKGTCGFLGLVRLQRVAHAAESVLVRLRDGALAATPEIVGAVFSACDAIERIVAGLAADGAEPAGDDAALIASLHALADGESAAPPLPDVRGEAAGEPAGEAQTIRVTVGLLDALMTLVGELVLTRNQIAQQVRRAEDATLSAPLQRLSQITSDLQDAVMKTRMQPVGHAWNRLPRLVRDLARDLGKRIDLVTAGAETELDRQVLEQIRDPLMHMVRNAADHGLEPPEERRAAGKPETGTIRLAASAESGHVVIDIADDGRGLSLGHIRAKALQRGLASETELAAMNEAHVLRFIFRAGFSTARNITEISGRGIGMDVVKTNVERIGGSVDVASRPGEGTTFRLKIPLTLAIAAALIVETGGLRFAIPQLAVCELVRARARQPAHAPARDGGEAWLERIDGTPMLCLRERLLPLVNLRALLHLGEEPADARERIVVVTQAGAHRLGLAVDAVCDTEEIVVKPVAPILRHITLFGGNTILGDGAVAMILDPAGIARASGISAVKQRSGTDATPRDMPGRDAPARIKLLLFRAGVLPPMAIPLAHVARIERIDRDRIETGGDTFVAQHRDRLMPLVAPGGAVDPTRATQLVLVIADGARTVGLIADDIIDVVEDAPHVQVRSVRPGWLGSAIVAGQTVEMIDAAHWLARVVVPAA